MGIGDAVFAIENGLPIVLPSTIRNKDNIKKMREREINQVVRYTQKMTWDQGGILDSEYEYDDLGISSKGVDSKRVDPSPLETVEKFSRKIRLLEKAISDG